MNAAYLAARRRGAGAFPMLSVDWTGFRNYDLGSKRYAPISAALPSGGALGIVPAGGFQPIQYGPGIKNNALKAVTTKVRVHDAGGELFRTLESYDPKGSPAAIDWVVPAHVAADWQPLFRGIVYDWEPLEEFVDLDLRTDDQVIDSDAPRPVFNRSDWSSAVDAAIYNTAMPLVFGIHDNFAVTARGMVRAVNVRYDDIQGLWWLASIGNLKTIRRVFFDGEEQTLWTVRRGVYGGALMTLIEVDPEIKPEKNVVVTFDCEGPDVDGLTVGDTMGNPIRQIRTYLEQYVYRNNVVAAWDPTPLAVIDSASWDAIEAYFELYDFECGQRIGGNLDKPTARDVLQEFLDSYPFLRLAWLEDGSLGIGILEWRDKQPGSAWLRADVTTKPGEFRFNRGRSEVLSHIAQPYMWSDAEQKFMASIEAHDIAAAPRPVWDTIENYWSQGRFVRD